MSRLLENKNIILTGSNRGIGKAMLDVFAENGANIWACTRKNTDEFEQYRKKLSEKEKVDIRIVECELTDVDDIKRAVKEIMTSKLKVDGLVNNAGIIYNALFPMSQLERVKEQFEVNFFAPYLLTQYVIKLMLKNKSGSIVNLASMTGLDGKNGQSAYAGTKAAVIGFTKTLSKEFGESGIRINALAPGYIETDMLSSLPEDKLEEVKRQINLRRTGTPKEVAKAAVFLLSDLSTYITGEVIRVDGGM